METVEYYNNLIKEGKTKWTLTLDRNDKKLSENRLGFAPFENTSKTNASIFEVNTATSDSKGEYTALAVPNNLNAIRACFLAEQFAKKYRGRLAGDVEAIINSDNVKRLISATDKAEMEMAVARTAYNTAKRQYERMAAISGVSASAKSKKDANECEALKQLKETLDEKAKAYKTAKANETKANWEIVNEHFKWLVG